MESFYQSNKYSINILAICLALLLIVILVSQASNNTKFGTQMVSTPEGVSDVAREKELVVQKNLEVNIAEQKLSQEPLSYSDFVNFYGDKRIQFDGNCRATPNSSSFNVGDILILDNRSEKVQAVKFVDDLYALPPYHVRIFELKRQGIFYIDCGSSKNVSEIIVH